MWSVGVGVLKLVHCVSHRTERMRGRGVVPHVKWLIVDCCWTHTLLSSTWPKAGQGSQTALSSVIKLSLAVNGRLHMHFFPWCLLAILSAKRVQRDSDKMSRVHVFIWKKRWLNLDWQRCWGMSMHGCMGTRLVVCPTTLDYMEWCGCLWETWLYLQRGNKANSGHFSRPHVFTVESVSKADVYTPALITTSNPPTHPFNHLNGQTQPPLGDMKNSPSQMGGREKPQTPTRLLDQTQVKICGFL